MFTVKYEEIPEEGLNLVWTEEKEALSGYLKEFSQIDFDFDEPLHSEVKIQKVGPSVLIYGKVETRLQVQCVRCLKEFPYPLSSEYEMTLHPFKETFFGEEEELSDKEMESDFFQQGEIHLSEIACEQVFLEMPNQPLCQEGCKGLCPHCGKDLNLSPCGCVKEEMGTGFSVLEKLKLD